MKEHTRIARVFAPEFWGEAEQFSRFYIGTYELRPADQRAVGGVVSHLHKAMSSALLARRLGPGLEQDNKELLEQGFTQARNGTELAAVFESIVKELYSSVDCTVKVLRAIYGRQSTSFKESTRKFFQGFERIGGQFPQQIKEVVAGVDWFVELRTLRDELTHLSTGQAHLNTGTGRVEYLHFGIKNRGGSYIIEDIDLWVREKIEGVNSFVGSIFLYLNSTLVDVPIQQVCGFVEGSILLRMVSPTKPLTFDSGNCVSYEWFERSDRPTCPFVDRCGAYQRKWPIQAKDASVS
jgi:hypothetical protein